MFFTWIPAVDTVGIHFYGCVSPHTAFGQLSQKAPQMRFRGPVVKIPYRVDGDTHKTEHDSCKFQKSLLMDVIHSASKSLWDLFQN